MKLLTLLSSNAVTPPEEVRQADRLTRYAVAARYPGQWEDVTESEYVEALRLAECVMRWAESVVTTQRSPKQ